VRCHDRAAQLKPKEVTKDNPGATGHIRATLDKWKKDWKPGDEGSTGPLTASCSRCHSLRSRRSNSDECHHRPEGRGGEVAGGDRARAGKPPAKAAVQGKAGP